MFTCCTGFCSDSLKKNKTKGLSVEVARPITPLYNYLQDAKPLTEQTTSSRRG